MNLAVDVERLTLAHKTVRAELLAEHAAGHWTGRLGSSPFATAAAVSALVIAHRRESRIDLQTDSASERQLVEQVVQGDLSELLLESVHGLARQQNADGGWGDCVGARSNVAATMMVQAAFRLTSIPAKYADLMARADDYVEAAGGVAGLRRQFGGDKPLVAAVLTNCALAGMVPWRQVPTSQFELACLPKRWQRELQVFAPRYSTPLLLALGRAKFHHDPPKNPISRLLRRSMCARSLTLLENFQAADDSYLASIPLTAFVVMSVSSIGCQEHRIVSRGVEFLLSSVQADSSWSVAPNFAVSNTALASISLRSQPPAPDLDHAADDDDPTGFSERCCDWLLGCQHKAPHPLTEVSEGGWATSDAAGSLPNAGATAGVLLALAHWEHNSPAPQHDRAQRAADQGIAWLIGLQNEDGGWPTYYRDDALLKSDESATDVTAQVLQALAAWKLERGSRARAEVSRAIENGWKYLESQQREDGSFIPLWFGNEHHANGHNPVYGTAQALLAAADLDRLESNMAERAARWLVSAQHANGGWGPPRIPVDYSGASTDGARSRRTNEAMAPFCSVEETALATSALVPLIDSNAAIAKPVSRGLEWLIQAIEQDRHRQPAIIGFSLSKIWYHERLYPLAFAAGALARAARSVGATTPAASHAR